MLTLEAPYPNARYRLFLPSPEWEDEESMPVDLEVKFTMTGAAHTHVKTNTKRHFKFAINLTSMKAYELREFYERYSPMKILLTTHKGVRIVGYIIISPLSLKSTHRAAYDNSNDSITTDIEFEGVII